MKRIAKVILIGLLLGGLLAALSGCRSDSAEVGAAQNQTITVQRGNLTIDITAVGNLALSLKKDLAFDLFYQEGTVAEVLVEEGDSVEKGQVLAKLDTAEWQKQLSTLENQVTTAERQLTTKKRDLLQAEINLRNAEIALEETETTYSLADFTLAQVEIRKAKENLEDTLFTWSKYGEGTPGYELYAEVVLQAKARLKTAENTFKEMLSGFGTQEMAIKKLQIEIAQGKLEDAQIAIEDAQKAVADAQEDLDEARSKSPVITAPFAGFVTKVNVEGGDEILTGTVAVQLADPEKFEANILVSEMDILQVKLRGTARVQVDAVSGLSLPAKITHISPTATIQQGVVNYTVKVEAQPFQAFAQERQEARQQASENITEQIQPGELPDRLKQAIAEGRITQEQAEEIMKRMPSDEMPFSATGGRGQTPSPSEGGRVPTAIPKDFQLREGLTVTVSIIVDERNNVLLVPNSAITSRGRQSYVNVVSAETTIEERTIQTGITNYQFTEVTEGLKEGEQIVVPLATTTATPTTQQGQRQGGGMFIPGMGRIR